METLLHIEPLSDGLALVCEEQVSGVLQISDRFATLIYSFIQMPLQFIDQVELELEALQLGITFLIKSTEARHRELLVKGLEHLCGLSVDKHFPRS